MGGKKWYLLFINATVWIIVAFSTMFLTSYPQKMGGCERGGLGNVQIGGAWWERKLK